MSTKASTVEFFEENDAIGKPIAEQSLKDRIEEEECTGSLIDSAAPT